MNIHRTKTEKANDLWRKQLGDLLTPPGNLQNFDLTEVMAVRLERVNEKRDVMISGLGFITIGPGDKVNVRVRNNVDVVLSNSIL